VQIQIKFNDFTSITRQVQLPTATYYTQDLFETAYALLQIHWPAQKGVRLVGISLSHFADSEAQQMSIFDLPHNKKIYQEPDNSHEKIDEVMDQIRQKYGADKIARASLLKPKEPSD